MHACGHDSHTAMALGAALLLTKEKLPGRVRFLFQPCEETTDEEGLSGAQRMAAEGAMDGVDYVLAQHVDPLRPVGTMGINAGPNSGGVDNWYATISGKGGHGAHPNKTVDPFHLMSHVIIALNGIVSRRIDPFEPAVVSIGAINGGHTENVIPESVKMMGTLRFTDEAVHQQIHEEMKRAFEIVKALGGEYELRFEIGGPPMIASNPIFATKEKGSFSEEKAKVKAIDLTIATLGRSLAKELDGMDWFCRIAKVEGQEVYINAGRSTGLKVGDVMEVFRPDGTGEKKEVKGKIQISAFFGIDASMGRLIQGKNPDVNDILKLAIKEGT